jgi:hypothetical protein
LRSLISVAGQGAVELMPGADVELGEDLVQAGRTSAGAVIVRRCSMVHPLLALLSSANERVEGPRNAL